VIRRPWPRLAALLSLASVVLLVSPAARPAQDRERPARPPAAGEAAAPRGLEIAVPTVAADGATLFSLRRWRRGSAAASSSIRVEAGR
jgi:hypothetical protein